MSAAAEIGAVAQQDDTDLPVGGLAKFTAAGVLVAMIVLAFTATWVTVTVSGWGQSIEFGVTLSRSIADSSLDAEVGGPGWAIAFAVILGIVALVLAFGVDTEEEFTGMKLIGGVVAAILVLATWLGRSVWLEADGASEIGNFGMGWGYWVCLALAGALLCIPASLGRASAAPH